MCVHMHIHKHTCMCVHMHIHKHIPKEQLLHFTISEFTAFGSSINPLSLFDSQSVSVLEGILSTIPCKFMVSDLVYSIGRHWPSHCGTVLI